MVTERKWSELTWIERTLIITARRIGARLGSWPTGNPAPAITEACQRFLEAHAPEYADARAWAARGQRDVVGAREGDGRAGGTRRVEDLDRRGGT